MPAPQRLLSVRNKIYILQPLPEKRTFLPFNLAQAYLGLLGLGTVAVVGYATFLIASLLNSNAEQTVASSGSEPLSGVRSPSPVLSPSANPKVPDLSGSVLRPSTNANQRSNLVSSGRKNPFLAVRSLSVLLPGQVKWKTTAKPTNTAFPSLGASPTMTGVPRAGNPWGPSLPAPIATIPPLPVAVTPNLVPPPIPDNPPFTPPFPSGTPPRQPFNTPGLYPNYGNAEGTGISDPNMVASGGCDVQVNGIIQTGGQPIVVVKVRSENKAYSRPVRIGDRLCNGAVGIRNIVGLGGPQPMVVLDQNGQEMTRPVDTNLLPNS